jgi:hypothetical protein
MLHKCKQTEHTNLKQELPLETAVGDQTHAMWGDLQHTLSGGKSAAELGAALVSVGFAFMLIR